MEEIYRGDTFEFDFDAENEETGESYIFSQGDVLKCGIKTSVERGTPYISKKTVEIEQATDIVSFSFSHNDTMDFPVGKLIVEIELTTSEDKTYTIFQGRIKVKGDVVDE